MVGGTYVYSRRMVAEPDEQAEADPAGPVEILRAARAANPGLGIERDANRRPYLWVRESATGREVQMPTAELAGAKIRFVDCDLGRIPKNLLYPNRTDITCLEVRNDRHRLSAYHFRSADGWRPMQAFFELTVAPEFRLGAAPRNYMAERALKKPFSHEFIVSYLLWDGWGFVGYEEAQPAEARP